MNVICIGASTNLVAALEAEPAIAKNVHLYLLGAQFFNDNNTWNKNGFNIQRDLNAFDALLNQPDLEMTVMPITRVRSFKIKKEETLSKPYAMHHPVSWLLADMWVKINTGEVRVMWDLALIIAIHKPSLATIKERPGPPENKRKSLHVYTEIDVKRMTSDFWPSLERYVK